MSPTLLDFTEKLVPVSDFSQGKAGKIFSDVAENNSEYIVLKNNQPTAVVISVAQYKNLQTRLAKFERLLEMAENIKLLRLAENRQDSHTTDFESLVEKEGFSMEELTAISESIEIE